MSTKRLWVNEVPAPITVDDFVWRAPADGPSSLQVSIDPDLAQFGVMPAANRDAVWLAAAVFLADRTTHRRTGWQRELQIVAPVSNPGLWRPVGDDVDAMLSFLTSDEWRTTFASTNVESRENEARSGSDKQAVSDMVCLFSGGADSVCGAVRALAEGHQVTLMSHWDWAGHSATQSRLIGDLQKQFDVEIPHVRVNLGRSAKQIGGATFGDEPSAAPT